MAYSDFSLVDVKEKFGLTLVEKESLFAQIQPAEYSSHLAETLQYNVSLATAINTEKARSELIVTPVLVELIKQFQQKISLFSGIEFNVDKSQGLNGICDYIISFSPEQLILTAPIITIVEAKNDNLKSGLGQCISAMIAAQLYNQQKKHHQLQIYGVVTTGSLWNFLKIEQNKAWIDKDEYHISNIAKIIGIFLSLIEKNKTH